jgi:hypothetical protein
VLGSIEDFLREALRLADHSARGIEKGKTDCKTCLVSRLS